MARRRLCLIVTTIAKTADGLGLGGERTNYNGLAFVGEKTNDGHSFESRLQ